MWKSIKSITLARHLSASVGAKNCVYSQLKRGDPKQLKFIDNSSLDPPLNACYSFNTYTQNPIQVNTIEQITDEWRTSPKGSI
jgi:hypothetical protein